MELWQEIVCNLLQNQSMEIHFPQAPNLNEVIESECYKTLQKIKDILSDDNLNDKECFDRIEAIVCSLEEIGSSGGSHHDFG